MLSDKFDHYARVLIDVDMTNHLPKNVVLDKINGYCVFIYLYCENFFAF